MKVVTPLTSKYDVFKLKNGDQFTRSNRRELFTGPEIGNTYQRGINWIGSPPNFELVIIKSKPKEYEDRWLHKPTLFLYYLRIDHKFTTKSQINYNSKENESLLNQNVHNAPVLLTIEDEIDKSLINVHGFFKVITKCADNEIHRGIDSVILKKISDAL